MSVEIGRSALGPSVEVDFLARVVNERAATAGQRGRCRLKKSLRVRAASTESFGQPFRQASRLGAVGGYAQPARRARPILLPSCSYLLASYCHAPILKRLSGSCSAFIARKRFIASCGNTPSISASLSGMALFKYVVT